MEHYCNYNLLDVVTPVNIKAYEEFLVKSNYDGKETQFLLNSFKNGFDIGYRGPKCRRDTAENIPFSVGDEIDLWNKIMKEVKLGRVAGPYEKMPFKRSFVQSPVGLVPKDGGKTRMIFHLSYNFKDGEESINHWTPKDWCSVDYNDLDHAVQSSLELIRRTGAKTIFYSKSDLSSAFRALPNRPSQRRYLLFKATNPDTGKICYFSEKNLPFGASILCSHFTRFSNSLRHIVEHELNQHYTITNYLDDFLFIETTQEGCNRMVRTFIAICKSINFPVSMEKTEWASPLMIFLGILLDGRRQCLAIPEEKHRTALNLVQKFKSKRKSTIRDLQQLSGYLNFLNKAIIPGRTFTRRMYAKFSGNKFLNKKGEPLKQYHHINLDSEFRKDCAMWERFLLSEESVNRPFIDLNITLVATEIGLYSDASANPELGFGAVFKGKSWIFCKWEKGFIEKEKPSIEFLELFGLVAGVLTWSDELAGARYKIFCDNESVKYIVNDMTAKCKQSMKLLRILTLDNMKKDRRIFVEHIDGKSNVLSDTLSRLNLKKFFRNAPVDVNKYCEKLPPEIWPLSHLWYDE